MILEDCNHVCVCRECAKNIDDVCPICRAEVTSQRRVYIHPFKQKKPEEEDADANEMEGTWQTVQEAAAT